MEKFRKERPKLQAQFADAKARCAAHTCPGYVGAGVLNSCAGGVFLMYGHVYVYIHTCIIYIYVLCVCVYIIYILNVIYIYIYMSCQYASLIVEVLTTVDAQPVRCDAG